MEREAGETSVADVLRLLSVGAGGAILVALGRGPLRTRRLTERLPQYAPRTIYRHASKLVEAGLVERIEGRSAPSAVLYRLTQPRGRNLLRIFNRYAAPGAGRRPGRRIDDTPWTAFCLLAEAWESGWVELLSIYPRSPTEIAALTDGLTFHQVNRRVNLLRSNGLLGEAVSRGTGKRYDLTARARLGFALVLEVDRWRRRYLDGGRLHDVTVAEAVTALRLWLPLMRIPRYSGMTVKFGIAGVLDRDRERGSQMLVCRIARNGRVTCSGGAEAKTDGWALGSAPAWIRAALAGSRRQIRTGGNSHLVSACLVELRDTVNGR